MKFVIIFAVALAVSVTAESEPTRLRTQQRIRTQSVIPIPPPPHPPGVSEEGIWKNIGNVAKTGLKFLLKEVGKDIIGKVKDILTDGLSIHPTNKVHEALKTEAPGAEGVFDAAGDIILRRAACLAEEHSEESGTPSHEGIINSFGDDYKISDAENFVYAQYNKSLKYPGPSHEGILGGLGGFRIRGLDDIVRGTARDVLRGAGNILGNLFYVAPKYPISKEGIIPVQPSTEGIISSAGNLIFKGAGKLAGDVLRGAFRTIPRIISNIFLARGQFSNYPTIHSIGHEIILKARHFIHHNLHPEAKECLNFAERNFTQLFDSYLKNGHECVAVGHTKGNEIIANVEDIVLDAVRKVEAAHRETGFCFDKHVEENKISCLDKDLPERIEEHREKVKHYAVDLADYVSQFSQLNTEFDVCLAGHLGVVRREVYRIIYGFHECIDLYPAAA